VAGEETEGRVYVECHGVLQNAFGALEGNEMSVQRETSCVGPSVFGSY